MTAEENLRLIQAIDANRRFLLLAYRSNSALQCGTDPRIRILLGMPDLDANPSVPASKTRRSD